MGGQWSRREGSASGEAVAPGEAVAAAPDEVAQKEPLGLASIQVTYITGKLMAELKEDVGERVSEVKKKVLKQMDVPYLTEVDLLLDGVALPHSSTLATAGLKPGDSYNLIGVLEQHWILDDSKKGDGVVLLEDGITVKNTTTASCGHQENKCRVILGKAPIPLGRHHFRIRLLEGRWYYLGVAQDGVDLNMWLGNDKGSGWSYYLRDDQSGSRLGPGYRDIGPVLKAGESVTFCFDTVEGTLEFAHNDEPLRPGQTGLSGKDLYLALGMGPNGVKLKLEAAWRER